MRVFFMTGLLSLALASGCAGSEFSGQAASQGSSSKKDKDTKKSDQKKSLKNGDDPEASHDPSAKNDDENDEHEPQDGGDKQPKGGNLGEDTDNADKLYQDLLESDDEIVCSRNGPINIDVNSGSVTSDTRRKVSNGVAAFLSPAFEFKLTGVKGNKLAIGQYGQDDVVMLVPASTTLDSLVTRLGGAKQINVPKDTVLVYNAADGGYAAGSVDDDGTIVYKFSNGQTVNLPGGQDKKLSEIYDLAPKLTPHTDIRLSKLQKESFYDKATKTVSFKVALIPHGIGYVLFKAEVKPCNIQP